MKNNNQLQPYVRKRNMLLLFPLLVLPFLTMAFWSLGGGKSKPSHGTYSTGLNLQLPGAKLKDQKAEDKLSFYEQAEKDSLKLIEQIKNDPYFKTDEAGKSPFTADRLFTRSGGTPRTVKEGFNASLSADPGEGAEQSLMKKLEKLNQLVNQPSGSAVDNKDNEKQADDPFKESPGSTDRLKQMMHSVNETSGEDPEMNQINSTLDKILDIQHPERVKEKMKKTNDNRAIKNPAPPNDLVASGDYLQPKSALRSKEPSNQFYDLPVEKIREDVSSDIIAVTDQSQELGSGSTIKLRLLSDVHTENILVPKNIFVYGLTNLQNDRLLIDIQNIRYKNRIVPVRFSVFDMDGIEGIHIPRSVSQDAANESFDRTIQSVGLNTLDPTVKMQAANAGIDMAKGLLSKKTKHLHFTVKAGYRLLLRTKND